MTLMSGLQELCKDLAVGVVLVGAVALVRFWRHRRALSQRRAEEMADDLHRRTEEWL